MLLGQGYRKAANLACPIQGCFVTDFDNVTRVPMPLMNFKHLRFEELIIKIAGLGAVHTVFRVGNLGARLPILEGRKHPIAHNLIEALG